MSLFLVERNFEEKIDQSSDTKQQINEITNEIGAEWLSTFLSVDGKRAYCLYEAQDTDQLREHSKVVGIPANEIVEVNRI